MRMVVDVWGGPGAPLNLWVARYIVDDCAESMALVRREVGRGYVVNVCALPPDAQLMSGAFDSRGCAGSC